MAPLHIMHYHNSKIEEENDWILFGIHLKEAKRIGVEAISVDVWWGLVEIQNINLIGLITLGYLI